MKVVLIGSGNIATQLGKSLLKSGHQIVQIYNHNLSNAKKLAGILSSSFTDKIEFINRDAGVYIIAIKDDKIVEVASCLKLNSNLVVHTSGSVDMNILQPCSQHIGVFYPLQTISKEQELSFNKIPLCIECNTENAGQILNKLASSISEKVYTVTSEQRKILHLAAVFASNFSNHMYAIAQELLEQSGFGLEMLKPLIKETAARIDSASPIKLQTGPAQREDFEIIKKHIEMLKNNPDLKDIYEKLTRNIIRMKKM